MARLIALLLLLLASDALACDYTARVLCPVESSTVSVPTSSQAFVWNVLRTQDNYAASGENVTTYAKMHKRGVGNSWAEVSETRCFHPRAGCHVRESDLVVNGPLQGGDLRLIEQMLFWPLPEGEGAPEATAGLYMGSVGDAVTTRHGIDLDLHCSIACLAVRAGERIALERTGRIAIRFNPASSSIEFLNGERIVWALPMGG